MNSLTRRYSILKDLNDAQIKEKAEMNELQSEQEKFGRGQENDDRILIIGRDLASQPASSPSNEINQG